jgi:hypothetical protein
MQATTIDQPFDSSEPLAADQPKKLFTATQISVGGFLAVPAGLAMLAMNFGRAGKGSYAACAWVALPLLTALLVAIGFAMPPAAPKMLIPLAFALLFRKTAEAEFRADYEAAADDPARKESLGKALGITLAGFAFAFGTAYLAVSMGE